jgi:hypothetical protein
MSMELPFMTLRARCCSTWLAALLIGSLPSVSPLFAQDAEQRASMSRALEIPRVTEPPRLEWFVGSENGVTPGQGGALVVSDFRQREPGDGTPVSQSTTAFLSYDDDHLYAVFVCKDNPDTIRSNVARREDFDSDDAVALYLDTFHDRERAYLFMVNPRGIQLDAIAMEGQSWDYDFDAVWASEGRLTADGYVVRVALPFRSLRFPRRSEQTWGIALFRRIQRTSEEAFWPHVTKRIQGFIPQFGAINGLRDISPSRNIEVNPYGVLARARFLDEDAVAQRSDGEQRLGIDAKFVVRNALTIDATLNPDFSQVESDDPQVKVNERFEVFFPEKRPSFIENQGFFQTPINLFFSRRIVDPGLGARLTGKVGRWAVGALAMNDREPGRRPPDDSLAGRNSAVGAFRLQREIGEESTVGVLLTDRSFASSFDRAFAVDTRWRMHQNWVASAQIGRSAIRALDGTRSSGGAALARIDGESRHFHYRTGYLGITPDFAAPLGFVRRVGFHETEQQLGYTWRPNRHHIISFGPAFGALFNWERSGQLQDRDLAGSFKAEFSGETGIALSHNEAFERFSGLGFRPQTNKLSFDTKWLRWLDVEAVYVWGTAVNHDPVPGMAPFLGRTSGAEMSFGLRPTPRLRLDQTYLIDRLDSESARVFTEQRLRTKLTYQFNRLLSLRAILDSESVVPNATVSDEEEKRDWSGDIMLTYLVNPGTALYLGYIDQYENFDIVRDNPWALRRTRSPTMSVGRQVFVKISYLMRY